MQPNCHSFLHIKKAQLFCMTNEKIQKLTQDALHLLQQLVAIPSLSRQEQDTALLLQSFLQNRQVDVYRKKNNIWCVNKHFDAMKPSLLLNSHHDTVAANKAYTRNPHLPVIENGKLYGLGTTDAGASLVSLLSAFLYFYAEENLAFNVVFAASAEEEISGTDGIELLFAQPKFSALFQHSKSFAIVGEPTELNLAIAEKGLMVLDCDAKGIAGHAARDEGENALYKAMEAIHWFRTYRFQKISPILGEIKMTVTSIDTPNKAHNVIPAHCSFVVDVRITEMYSHEEILAVIQQYAPVQVIPRSTRLRSSSIPLEHPVVQAGIALGKTTYGSPTTSDKALIPLPSLKCGPGFSGQSHSADEFIEVEAIGNAVQFYTSLLEKTFVASAAVISV